MSNAKYLQEAYVDGLNKKQIEAMLVYNLKEVSNRIGVSYYLLRKAAKGDKIPRSVYSDIVAFLERGK